MKILATEEFLKRFLKDLKESQKRWCGDCVDDSEEILLEYPEWINSLIPEVEDLLEVPHSGLYIVSANYGTDSVNKEVTKMLREGGYPDSLSITVDNRTIECDPAPGLSKRLEVYYTYNGVESKEVIPEGQLLNIVKG